MKFVDAKCPNCGQVLKVDSAKEAAICEACGSAFIVEKAVQNFNITNVTHNNVTNITNVYTKVSDFVIEAGVLKKYKGESPIVHIPNNVSCIGSGSIPDSVTEVYMPDSVEEIHCVFGSRLKKIKLSNSLKTIGCNFSKNCALTTIQLPSQLEKIDDYAFFECEWLREITLPASVKEIGKCAFKECSALTRVSLNNGLQTINESVFADCSSLRSITLPASIKEVGKSAFEYCIALTNVSLKNGLQVIKEAAFCGCESLHSIVLPSTLRSVGPNVFLWSGLDSISVPDSVTQIGIGAFASKNIQTIVLGNGITELKGQFCNQDNLIKSFKIPRSVKKVYGSFIEDFRRLEKIYIPQSVEYISSCHYKANTVICCECKKPFFGNPKGWEKGWSDGAKKVRWGVTEEEFDRL